VGTGSSGSAPKPRSRRPAPEVSVLRVGHRPGRDPRLTTHLALAARALGARRLYLHPPDAAIQERLAKVVDDWGGTFEVIPTGDWKAVVRSHPGPVVHLTMYGLPLDPILPRLRRSARVLVVVGGAKVPAPLYALASHNVAIGNQPHSEVAALAVALVGLGGVPGPERFRRARRRIVPTAHGKRMRGPRRAAR
jgi:tRNA (cytidine56-2'-O)-methyltransferase